MTTKYTYPAIFTEDEGQIAVEFPDLPEIHTCGDDLNEAMEMAKDALCLTLYNKEEDGQPIPKATDIRDFICKEDSFMTLINCDTIEYRRLYNSKAVKKTLSIPAWLNTLAERAGINFSSVLQEALKKELDLY